MAQFNQIVVVLHQPENPVNIGSIVRAVKNMGFGPVPADLKVGDVVVWANDDIFRHTATASDRSF
ncbi:MAG: hypothetical protein ACK47M_07995, partial [Caldilinea sp.]